LLKAIDPFDKALMHTGTALRHAGFAHIQQQGAP